MMDRENQVEISAKTVEEAIEVALRELDAERGEVEVEITNPGRTGIFGIRSEQARVRVTRLAANNNLASEAIEAVSQLLKRMDASALATIRSSGDEEIGPAIDIQGEDSGLLIGKRGETLQALQFLLNMILGTRGSHPLVVVDLERYKERRSRSLEALATRVAARVVSSGRPITLEPMPASERRIIHITLADNPNVATASDGDRQNRKVTVTPRR